MCRSELSLRGESGQRTVESGELLCTQCERSFPIEGGIPRFIDPQELEGPNRRFARSYDWFSRIYSLFTKMAFIGFGGERKARKEILDRLESTAARTLEVSVGTGDNLPYLYESPSMGEVYGLDISSGQLARCRSLVTKHTWPVDLFLGTAEALPFKAESFDSVLHVGGINFFSGKKQAIDEMIRVARPGSKIVIADESERLARFLQRMPGFSRAHNGKKPDAAVPVDLVPDTMKEIRVDGIWKAHGRYHGYCLEFRKPAA
jgi:ubiquinone/menaquinone biosynthesis C-methylase UbiE/uncharacterized protein YbaR (Trm112 family)